MTDSVRNLLLWAGLTGCLALSAGQAQTSVNVGDLPQAKPLGDSDRFIVCQVVPCPAGTQLNAASLAQIRSYLARAPLQLHVVNNSALKALSATQVNHVIRDGFAAPGDGGAATYDLTTAACSAADNGLQVALNNGGCAITKPAECPVLQLWGGSGDGSTDNTTAWNAAAASDAACLRLSRGIWKFNSKPIWSLPNDGAPHRVTLRGDGPDASTILMHGAVNGPEFQLHGWGEAISISSLSIVTDQNGTNTGLYIRQNTANPWAAIGAMTDITNVTFRGADGYPAPALNVNTKNAWANNVMLQGVSNVNLISVNIQGPSAPVTGSGIWIFGDSAHIPVAINLFGVNIIGIDKGLYYDKYTQGVTVTGSNIVSGNYGIYLADTVAGFATYQLSITTSSFNNATNVELSGGTPWVNISNNTFLNQYANSKGIHIGAASWGVDQLGTTICNNTFTGWNNTDNTTAISIASGLNFDNALTICNNTFDKYGTGIDFGGSSGIRYIGNTFRSNVTTKIKGAGSATNIAGVDAAGQWVFGNGLTTLTTGNPLQLGGAAPTVSGCGTGASVSGTDNKGTITTGSGTVTACSLGFGSAATATPSCILTTSSSGSVPAITTISTTGFTVGLSASLASGGKIYYFCPQ